MVLTDTETRGDTLSPLDKELNVIADQLRIPGEVVRDLDPQQVKQLVESALAEKNLKTQVQDVSLNPAGKEGPEMLLNTGKIKITVGNKEATRRDGQEIPDIERQVKVISSEGVPALAKPFLGSINGQFKKQLSTRLEQRGVVVDQVGIQVTARGLRVALQGGPRT